MLLCDFVSVLLDDGNDVGALRKFFEASGISVGLRAPDSGVKRCEHGARSAECLQRAV